MAEAKNEYVFDFERLEVYRKAMELVVTVFRVTRPLPREYQYSVGDQLRRAALSILNNLAEGSGKLSEKEKAQFYKTSLNSARECIPMFTVLMKEHQLPEAQHQTLRQETVHIANMLGRLVASIAASD